MCPRPVSARQPRASSPSGHSPGHARPGTSQPRTPSLISHPSSLILVLRNEPTAGPVSPGPRPGANPQPDTI